MSTHISQIAESQDGNELRHNDSSRGGRGTRRRRNRNRGGHGGRDRSGVAHHTSGGDRGSRPSGRSRGRGGRRGDGEARRAQHISAARVDPGSGRIFAGRLTRPDELEYANDRTPQGTNDSVENGPASLRADAPEFVPGAPSKASPSTALDSHPPTQRKAKQPRNPKTKSTADDIATRTHEDIQNGFYECPICTSELGRRSKVWSCKRCWTVFHLSCIKKWSNNEGSAMERPRGDDEENTEALRPRLWRCPGCNLPQDVMPSIYSCWCEKEIDPRPLPGLPPHSCGQSCSKSRNGCPHPCNSVCHAGPCASCQAMGPTQRCFCGRHESTKRCVDTDYENGWSCMKICGELLSCLRHKCQRPCHEGPCGACEESVHARCYCGKVTKDMPCRGTGEEKYSEREIEMEEISGEISTWTGSFDCTSICDRVYDCGLHRCQQSCHPQSRAVPHCPSSPDVVKHCQCGKSLLSDIPNAKARTSCEDPIPTCEKPCGKVLPCKHTCPKVCHSGPCPPCFLSVDIKCRCGRTSSKSLCHQGFGEPPQCMRVCKAPMNCGRHTCGERCCPGQRQSIERQAAKRKLKPFSLRPQQMVEEIEAEHICTRVCNRTLKCSKHNCRELCHRGVCKTCPEAIFEEVSCHCGRTVLQPPLPCGTTAPACHYDCERPKPCGHPQTPHTCHMDDENCPKCPYFVEKKCLCGRTSSKQPCSQPNGQCAFICSKPSKCGAHTCQRFCHRPGECSDSNSPCQKTCGKRLKTCGHPCQERCHAPYPCSESTPCRSRVSITCACGRLTEEKKCSSTRETPRTSDEKLKCDDECARLKRNRDLASALNIDIDPVTTTAANPTVGPQDSDTLPYSDDTLDLYVQLSSSSTLATLQGYEASLHALATQDSQKSNRFPPCRSQLRAFIHSLAGDWGFQSESFDPEPVRHVFVYKAPGWISPGVAAAGQTRIGIRGLSVIECIKLRERERAKEKEARRAAAEKARHEAEQLNDEWTVLEQKDEHGWSRVVSKKKPQWWNDSDIQKLAPNLAQTGPGEGSSMGLSSGRFGSLILKSGVGRGKEMDGSSSRPSSSGGRKKPASDEEVVDDWEEEIEKEEKAGEKEKEEEKEKQEPSDVLAPDHQPWDWASEGEGESYIVETGFPIVGN
ncbi:NF-X1 type zinc finger family protein [Coccidioides posadasii C735 delta SOWgp]|uniref:NF-X1 type zinc finger family protein n=1 Tax=Coccidioides posadasii (strain C735) TaxID=222929 RepID=C5P6P4_COCP7|nr:NF-X1 type zinc finger family protein [Coccidioides posadasii C735 delta SOWgp]EER27094.1 NF-X1 type zinc finger family protein [Coccidioides posadasii C735 delta SOWgp]|eukprot:XP_003069239.1 NF-X1 type zinc finger family protein [Coccidioides posadasii C735 delta SOWgp]